MLKITKYFLFNCLVVGSALAFYPLLVFSQQHAEVQSIVRLTPSAGEYHGAIFEKKITPGDSVPFEGDYRLKAQVVLQQESAQQVVETLGLNWASPTEVLPAGWRYSAGTWRWSPSSQKSGIEFPIALPNQSLGQQPSSITDFNHLWFDYRERGNSDNCEFSFAAEASAVDVNKSSATFLITGEKAIANLRPTLRLQAAKDVWLPMDRSYSLKRKLNMDFDEHWRNQQVGMHTQLQKRLHRNLDRIEAVDFLFKSEADIESITLRIAHDEWFKSDTLLSWDVIPHQIETTPDGLVRVRLKLGEWLRKKNNEGDGLKKIFLTETIVLLKGQSIELVMSRPLHEIVFLENLIEQTSTHSFTKQNVSLSGSSTLLAPGYKRWILDLRPLNQGNWFDLHLKSALLAIRPGNPDRECSLQPLSLRLVSLANKNELINIADVRRWLRKFGGPFNLTHHEKKEVEWAEIDAYIPWSLLPASSFIHDSIIDVKRLVLPEWGLSFQEKGGSIKIAWELSNVATQATSTLFLRVTKESKDIKSGKARIDFNDGSSSTINFLPNLPIPLGAAANGKHTTKITLDLERDKSSGALLIQELTLFRPFLISQTDSFSARRPAWEFLPLRFAPENEKKVRMSGLDELVVHGVTQPNSASSNIWRTPINLASKNLTVMKIGYELSELPQNQCWLKLRVRTASKQVQLTLCPNGVAGELNHPLSYIMKQLQPDDRVLDLEWEVNPSHAAVPLTFEIQAQLGSFSLPSIRELLAQNVSVNLGDQSFLPLADQSVGLKNFSTSGRGWLNFGEINFQLAQKPAFYSVDSHPYIQVQKLMFEDDHPLTAAEWSKLYPSEMSQSAKPSLIIRLTFILVLGLLAWLLWSRGILQKVWEGIFPRAFGPEKYFWSFFRKLWLRIVKVKTLLAEVLPPFAVFMILSISTLAFYAFGLLLLSGQGENYLFTVGSIFAVFSWHALLLCSRHRVVRFWPNLAEKIYKDKGTIYFTGAFFGLSVTAVLLAFNLQLIAKHVATIVYYLITLGAAFKILGVSKVSMEENR
jgi:hypothetical protein